MRPKKVDFHDHRLGKDAATVVGSSWSLRTPLQAKAPSGSPHASTSTGYHSRANAEGRLQHRPHRATTTGAFTLLPSQWIHDGSSAPLMDSRACSPRCAAMADGGRWSRDPRPVVMRGAPLSAKRKERRRLGLCGSCLQRG
jgi:hypothetical protein